MKTTAIAASAIIALMVLGATSVAFAHSGLMAGSSAGQSQSTTTTHSGEHEDNDTDDHDERVRLAPGMILTFTNLDGHWVAFSHEGNHNEQKGNEESKSVAKSGSATGSFTFKVLNQTEDGFKLSIVSGTFKVHGVTYTVSSGQLTLNEGGKSGSGSGTASDGATFRIHIAGIHGNLTSNAQVGAIKLDVKVGSSEYLVVLGTDEDAKEVGNDRD
jgi:hypothetical protein